MPRPAKTDDPSRAEEATRTYRALREDAERVASLLLARFERAMCEGRRWTPGDFQEFLVAHPLMGRLVRRLVWATWRGAEPAGSFRVTDEGDFADIDDRTWELPHTAEVGVAHPLELGEAAVVAWASVLSDYRIVQPFPQLARPTFTPTDEEAENQHLLRLEGTLVYGGRLFALRARGWRPDAGGLTLSTFRRQVRGRPEGASRHEVTVTVHPGLDPGDPDLGEHKIVSVVVTGPTGNPTHWSDVAPVAFSEVVADWRSR